MTLQRADLTRGMPEPDPKLPPPDPDPEKFPLPHLPPPTPDPEEPGPDVVNPIPSPLPA